MDNWGEGGWRKWIKKMLKENIINFAKVDIGGRGKKPIQKKGSFSFSSSSETFPKNPPIYFLYFVFYDKRLNL